MIKEIRLKKYIILLFLISIIFLSLIFNLQSLISTIPLVHADEAVSAFVPPRVSDYQFDFSQDASPDVHNQATILYQILYGSTLDAINTRNITIVADWSDDKAPNGADLFDYLPGSASNGYGDVKPVVNLTNHTITWTIPTLPAKVNNQTVTFYLTTNSNYSGSSHVPLNVTAFVNNQFFTLPVKTLSKTYTYYQAPPAPATITPTLAVSPTPSPTPTPAPLRFTRLSFAAVSTSDATIALGTSLPTTVAVRYGTTPTNLSKKVTSNSYATQANITLNGLTSQTTYYVQTIVTTANGQTRSSEIFTFQTAKPSSIITLDDNVIVVTSNGNVLTSGTQKQNANQHPAMIMTVNSDYEISYTLTKPIQLRSIDAVVQNKVLGASTVTTATLAPDLIIPMQEKAHNLYVANLKAVGSGSYDVFVRIVDTNGNIIEKKVADLKVMPHLTVYALDTGRPLADARIFLYYYDNQTHNYQPLSQALFGAINNPSYTDFFGQSNVVLPPGRYRIEESSLFYDKTVADFTIGTGSDQNFPLIYLKKNPFNILSLATFTADYLKDSWDRAVTTLQAFSSSIRIFHLVAAAILGSVIVLSFLFFTLRTQIKIRHVPIFFFFHLDKLLNAHRQKYLYGSIIAEDNHPLSQALIEIEDANTHTILTHTNTNKLGKFYLRNTFPNAITLLVTKEGFEPTTYELAPEVPVPDTGLRITLKKGKNHQMSFYTFLLRVFCYVLGLLFEMSLVLSIILEIIFLSIYGIDKTIVYFMLSLINIIFWLLYIYELRVIRDSS